jgi:hypothetical protein
VDQPSSAITTSCLQWARILNGQILYSNDFISQKKLLKKIKSLDPRVIFFAWRGALIDIIKQPENLEFIKNNLQNSKILFSIPDHMGVNNKTAYEEFILKYADGYTVVSKELYELYSDIYPLSKPTAIMQDLPNCDLVNTIFLEKIEKKGQIIWVGNSVWGKRLGFQDHKGYYRFVLPLFKMLDDLRIPLNQKIIDRGIKFTPQVETLRKISQSKYLVQFSDSEGTGLPIIEACGLGTIPITTEVGVAKDLLNNDLSDLIVKNINEAVEIIIKYKDLDIGDKLTNIYHLYVQNVERNIKKIDFNQVKIDKIRRSFYINNSSSVHKFKICLMWLYRYINKYSRVKL